MSDTTRRFGTRLLAPQNVISVLVGVAVFLAGLRLWDTTFGVAASALAAALLSGLVWLIWWFAKGPPAAAKALETTHLGDVPPASSAAPTLLDATSRVSAHYRDLVAAIQGHTTGQVLLVSSSGSHAGQSSVPLNLAVAATQLGLRAVLIDGDLAGDGLSRYSSSGNEVGLTDVARGDASLAEASQMWDIGDGSLLPVVTAGSGDETGDVPLDGLDLAAAFDAIGERADLVLIDAPSITSNPSTGLLAAHADGSILIIDNVATARALTEIREGLDEAGAPVIGYISEVRPGVAGSVWMRMLKRSAAAFALIALVYLGFTGFLLWSSWNGVSRQALDTDAARQLVDSIPAPPLLVDQGEIPLEDVVVAEPTPMVGYRSFLLVGTDETAGIADVVMLAVLPADGSVPFVVSLPRDLYVPNRCTSGYTRINATLHGCGEINGPTFLSLAVEDFTGISVDHFALFDFGGFADIIDSVGGVEICVEHDRRDWRADLDIKAGCTSADGATALAWVRSRHPQDYIDGRWRTVAGSSDLLRIEHQQEVLLQLLAKLNNFDSPTDLARKVDELSAAFTLDEGLGIGEAISLAWGLRGLDIGSVNRLEIPVVYSTTHEGQLVLRATMPFDEILAELYPGLLDAAGANDRSASG